MIYNKFFFVFLGFFLGAYGNNKSLINFNPDSLRYKVAFATRCESPPKIDGILSDQSWGNAIPIEDFLQIEPIEFAQASENTVVKILFDDNALYLSFENFDSQPNKIRAPLTRRDAYMDGFNNAADFVGFAIDSKNDDYNGKWFGVNAAGVKIDVNVSGQEDYDRSWNAVWDASVSKNGSGWVAEVKVPFSVFQYDNKKDMIWGISFNRHIHKTQEEVLWPGRQKSHVGIVSSFGVLIGLNDIPEPKKIEIIPYGLSSFNKQKNNFNYGLDLRYGLSSSAVINSTVNPDFGQVEADPSVLNLSAFETFYDEKRPFFSEGANFFQHKLNLFHSRRIGGAPNYFLPDSGDLENLSDNTTIIGAFKLIGSTMSGWNYGMINAITSEENADLISSDNKMESLLVEPQTNYSVGRIEKSIINKFSRIGFMATDVTRKNINSSNVSGIDWKIALFDNRLFTNGQIVRSNTNEKGNAYRFNVGYKNPRWWETRFWHGWYDDKFDINDIGYLKRNNLAWAGMMVKLRQEEPFGPILGSSIEIKLKNEWNGDNIVLEDFIEFETWTLLKNYWRFGTWLELEKSAYNDEDIFRDDQAWVYATEKITFNGFWLKSDRRKKIILSIDVGSGNAKRRGKEYSTDFSVVYKPLDPLNIEVVFKKQISPKYMQYVDILENGGEISRIYSNSKQVTEQIQFRLNWTFSPDLTLEGYYQPFFADMKYNNYNNLLAPETMDLEPFDYLGMYDNPNFKVENRVGTFVARWEYNPGSTIFVVYNINENRYYSENDKEWTNSSENALVIKLNYWMKK